MRSARFARSAALAGIGLALLAAMQARRVMRARALCRDAPAAFSRDAVRPSHRILAVGDSTGAGVGCGRPQDSMGARLAAEFPAAQLHNLCRSGARVAGVLAQVEGMSDARPAWDLALVFAGGNDILRATPPRVLARQAGELVHALRRRARAVVWIGIANVGLAPAFLPPLSWWLSWRARRMNRALAAAVRAAGGEFLDFFRERAQDPFSAQPLRFYAADGVHPSSAAHQVCWLALRPLAAGVLRPRAAGPVRP